MFEVSKTPIGQFSCYRLINKVSGEYMEVLSDMGAGINDLTIKNNSGELVSVVSGYRSADELRNTHHTKYRGAKLSPFPNRIVDGAYSFENEKYQLPINEIEGNNNLHAFLHNRPFEVVDTFSDDSSARLKLSFDYKGTEKGYPFPYKIWLDIVFDEKGVKITTEVENTGNTDMPLGDGWHPYFKYGNIDVVKLQMGEAKRVTSLTGNSLSDLHGFETSKAISTADFDDCFEITTKDEIFEISLEDENANTKIVIWQENEKGKYRYFQVFTPPSRDEIAIEPVTCPPNAFNTKKELIVLKPQEKTGMKMGIRF